MDDALTPIRPALCEADATSLRFSAKGLGSLQAEPRIVKLATNPIMRHCCQRQAVDSLVRAAAGHATSLTPGFVKSRAGKPSTEFKSSWPSQADTV